MYGMANGKRMQHEKRREAILTAVAPIFARKGLHGATTRELAAAAGISEALLYKHFPSKSAIFHALDAMETQHALPPPGLELILHMPPTTGRLVRCIRLIVTQLLHGESDTEARLIAQSLLDDGDYARSLFAKRHQQLVAVFLDSLQAAAKAGDLRKGAARDESAFWLTHHLALGVRLLKLPMPVATEWQPPEEEALDTIMLFVLRGIGLKNSAINHHYVAG